MRLSKLLWICTLMVCTAPVLAQPVNDDCANATPISEGVAIPFDTIGATNELAPVGNAPCGSAAPDVWYSFVASCTGTAAVETTSYPAGGPNEDTVVQAVDGVCGGTSLGCDDDDGVVFLSALNFPVIAGNPYLIRISGWGGTTGTGTFDLTCYPPPINDDCSGAISIAAGIPAAFATAGATNTVPALTCAGSRDVWYEFTPTSTDLHGIALTGLTFDVGFVTGTFVRPSVYLNPGGGLCPTNAELVTCITASSFSGTASLTAGVSYLIRVGVVSSTGDYRPAGDLTVSEPAPEICDDGLDNDLDGLIDCLDVVDCGAFISCLPPVNDECAGALPAVLGVNGFDNLNSNNSVESTSCPNGTINNDVFWTYTPPADGTLNAYTCGQITFNTGSTDTEIAIYTGACGALTCLVGNDDSSTCSGLGGTTLQSFATTPVIGGVPLVIRVGSFSTAAGVEGIGTWTLEFAPTNDNCANALAIGEGSFDFHNIGGTLDGPIDCNSNMTGDVWFLYTASTTGTATIATCGALGTLTDTVLAVFDGAAGCPLAGDFGLDCDDDGCVTPNFSSTLDIPVTGGGTYYVQVGGWQGGEGDSTLTVNVTPSLVNDNCADAIAVGEGSFGYSNIGATLDGPTTCDPQMSTDVWFHYTVGATGSATIETCNTVGSLTDTVLTVYSGAACPSAGDGGIICADDTCGPTGFNSSVELPVVAGETYYIQVGGWLGTQGDGTLDITVAIPGDTCGNAFLVNEGSFDFDNTGAISDGPNACDNNMGRDLWFEYTATNTGNATIETCNTIGSLTDTVLTVYDGTVGCPLAGDVGIICNDDSPGCGPTNFNSSVEIPVTAGNVYLIQVGGWNGAQGDGTLDISVCDPPTPSFSAGPLVSGIAPLTVNFLNTSDDGGDAGITYSWAFGDPSGGTSGAVSPSYAYTDCGGPYSVTLTANACGVSVPTTTSGLVTVFSMGDTNGDCNVDTADPIYTATYLFGGGSAPVCPNAADVNGDGNIDIADVIHELFFLFGIGGPLVPGGPGC